MIRRRAILSAPIARPNTSPRIAEYNKRLTGATGTENVTGYCYTDWIIANPTTFIGEQPVIEFGGIPVNSNYKYQFETSTGAYDYWYPSKPQLPSGSKRIRFTLKMETLSSAYAYNKYSGQIYFAGPDTIYYGYININDMP